MNLRVVRVSRHRVSAVVLTVGLCLGVQATTLYFAGDSTLDDNGRKVRADAVPYRSWGTTLERYMAPGNKVDNHAKSGASTKSFVAAGYWTNLIARVQPGDWVGIQFGHNDQKRSTPFYLEKRWADPKGLFREIVRDWVKQIRAKGANPLLLSPICRGTFDKSGDRLLDSEHKSDGVCLRSYAQAMRELSVELGCDFVDMNALTRELLERTGKEEAMKFFAISSPFCVSKDGEPKFDVTHPIEAGATAFAKLFIRDVRARNLPIAKLFAGKRPTEIMFWFDTEAYNDPAGADPIGEIAKLLTAEGVRGHFCFVGYEAKKLVDWRRMDVLDALKPHVMGSQTLYHTWHPNITEATDIEDFGAAYKHAAAEEYLSDGMIMAATGKEKLLCSVLPGNGNTIVALYLYADMGISFFGGGCGVYDDGTHAEIWYCNQRHRPYCPWMHLETFLPGRNAGLNLDEKFDRMAKCEGLTLYMHPHMAVYTCHPDGLNWDKRNMTPFGKWVKCPHHPPEVTKKYYADLQAFVHRLKNDPRFEVTDCEELLARQQPRTVMRRSDVAAMRAALEKDLGPLRAPTSWTVFDCYRAATLFLRGESRVVPGKSYGFLYEPKGVTAEVTVTRAELEAAARNLDVTTFVPPQIAVGAAKLGPADYLFAALEALETGAEKVTVRPRADQLGDVAAKLPTMAKFTCAGTWRYMPTFKDEWTTNRLKWQLWTLRYEE